MRFQPSRPYGEPPSPVATAALAAQAASTGTPPPSSSSDMTEYVQYVALAKELVLPSDPEERAKVLRAKIKNYQGMKRKIPLMATFYDNEIRKLRAKLDATKSQIAKKKKGEQSTQVFRYLGWAAGGLTVLLIGSMVYRNIVTTRVVAAGGK